MYNVYADILFSMKTNYNENVKTLVSLAGINET